MENSPARFDRDPLIFGSAEYYTQTAAANPSDHATPPRGDFDHTRERTKTPGSPREESNPWAFEMCFDYPKYEGGVETDATTQSDLFSEGSPETNPSALTAGSSVGTGTDVDDGDDHEMLDAPITPEPHHDLLWPKESNTDLPRHPTIHDHEDLTPHYEATTTPTALHPGVGHMRRHSGVSLAQSTGKKTRIVANPKKTSRVREKGSCILCKGCKVSCSDEGVCPACIKHCGGDVVAAAKICIRRAFLDSVGGRANRWCRDSTSSHTTSSFQPAAGSFTVSVSFSENPHSPQLHLQATRCQRGGLVIRPGIEKPHHDAIAQWARRQLESNASQNFDSLIQQLLIALDHTNSLVFGSFSVMYQEHWLNKLLRMRCMWNVWSCKKFYVRDSRGQLLADSTLAVHDYLNGYAGGTISQLEKDVLRELDRLQKVTKGYNHTDVWVALWQLLLMYRQSASLGFHRDQFQETTEELFNKVVVLYSALFRTTKTLNSLKDAGSNLFVGKPVVKEAFERAWRVHTEFYASFRPQLPGDELIRGLIIDKELEVLARKRNRK
ncbi:hypothetical protein QBC34DRAFT_138490 [Podospora aff. communis PSN243]|uniref:Zn(2)-C6 fungal-type domain-containing protein n=1 Tax=Podospora aff. communis PSN243 TaxID=3040156 RepID=A0AAV9H4J8_9PEZI|nr:hypothetical protein QBC34DRAFT_138490 [Podospora aff. communis PSN243]